MWQRIITYIRRIASDKPVKLEDEMIMILLNDALKTGWVNGKNSRGNQSKKRETKLQVGRVRHLDADMIYSFLLQSLSFEPFSNSKHE